MEDDYYSEPISDKKVEIVYKNTEKFVVCGTEIPNFPGSAMISKYYERAAKTLEGIKKQLGQL